MSYPLRQLAIILCFVASLNSLQASPGANVPWITYEAENMTVHGGIIFGPPTQVASITTTVSDSIQMEASGGKAVELNGTGQYVEFTAQSNATAIVVRYCVPDTATGGGTNSTISLYQNGVFVQKLPVTSQYSWLYGAYPWTNTPTSQPRDFFDEVRLSGLTINAGDTVRIEKDADDTAAYDIIDLVDLENVAAPSTAPVNTSLSITDFGAVGDGVTDCTTALINCISAANSQGKTVWIPPGNYLITGTINLPSNTTIQGAGMWYSELVGNPSLYGTVSRRVNFNGAGSNIHLSDFAILGRLTYRNDSEGNDGLGGSYGTGSTISHIWVEHTKTAAWIVNSSGLVVSDCRFRDTIADGININKGMQGTIVTNCTARENGDDAFAMWPASGSESFAPGSNVFTHCTGQLTWLSSGGAIYGGANNRIEDCVFSDIPYGAGILISAQFADGKNVFSGTTIAQRCNLTRCGGYELPWPWRGAVTICPYATNIIGVNLNNLNISNSLSYAVQIVSPGSSATSGVLSNATMNNINVSTYGVQVPPFSAQPSVNGVYGVCAQSTAYGSLSISGLTVNGALITSIPASGSVMNNQSIGSPQHFTFNFIPSPTITLTTSGNILQIWWPMNYIGWTLQMQTNAPDGGISTNWSIISGSTITNQFFIPIDNTIGSTFFRLVDL
jgi:hypothetical protein